VSFLSIYRLYLNGAFFSKVSTDGGGNDQDPDMAGIEANLSMQYAVGLANFLLVTFYSVGQSDFVGLIHLAEHILRERNPPTVLTISYGFIENQVPRSLAARLCDTFMQLGARGISVIVASGDGGVAGSRPNNTCIQFVPTFPASCPFS